MKHSTYTLKFRTLVLLISCLFVGKMNAQDNVEIRDDYHWFLNGLYVKCINGYDFDRVAVVPRGTYRNSKGYTLPYPSYSGDVHVPTYVEDEYGNKMYVVCLQGSFGDCENVTSVTLSEGLEEIRDAFTGCTKITTVTIPNSVKLISGSVFYGCTSLKNVTFNNSADIDFQSYSIFEGCTSLSTIELPSQITGLPNSAFKGCTSLKTVKLSNNISRIGINVFENCTSLEEINLPTSLTMINDAQFRGCSSLKKVTLGNDIKMIGSTAFMGCSSLKTFNVPEGVTTLSLATFRECTSLESVTLPSTLTALNAYVFYLCDNLKDVYCLATTPPSIQDATFSTFGTLHVPAGSKSAYEAAEYWNNFTIVEDVTTGITQAFIDNKATPRKVVNDGTVTINYNGIRYDMSGKSVK